VETFSDWQDAVIPKSRRTAPHHDIAMHQSNALGTRLARVSTKQESSWQPERHGHDRRTEIVLVLVLM
jgi:hypothetical protein